MESNNYIIYLLVNSDNNYTYVGITNNRVRRLRQHNGELVGGARYTKIKKGSGEWYFYGYIENVDKHIALSLEKKIKIRSRQLSSKSPLEKRLQAIDQILNEYNKITENSNLEFTEL